MSFSDLTLVQYKDRVRDFTLSTSTPFVLEEEPPLGYQGFGDALSDGQRCHYVVLDSNGTWALYRGDYSATGISISALTFLAGSATAPAFSSERKEIFLVAAGISYEELIDEIARLGTLAASSVPFPISAGGTSASTAAGARTALGLAIGSDVQAWDLQLEALAGFAAAASQAFYFTSASVVAAINTAAFGRSLLSASDAAALEILTGFITAPVSIGEGGTGATTAAAARTALGVAIGSDVQAWDVVLDGFAALTTASHVPFFSAASTVSSFGSQAYGRSLLDTANEAGLKALINAEAGVDFQAWNAQLQAHADLAANGIITRTAATTISARSVAAGLGITLTNGDGVAGNPTVALNISGLTTATDIDTAADFLPYYDSSASTIKKTLASAIGGSGSGKLVQRVYATYTAHSSTTDLIDTDDTIPQNTEGAETVTASITPTDAANIIRIRVEAVGLSGTAGSWNMALFQDSIADALASTANDMAAGHQTSAQLVFEHVASNTTARTYKLRVGNAGVTGGGTFYFNGNAAGRLHGGVQGHRMVIEEITP